MLLPYWHRNPGSLRVVRTSRRPFQSVLYGLRSNQAFTLLAPDSWKSASGLILSQTDAFDSGCLDSRNLSLNLLAPESWKSASGLVVSHFDAFNSGGSCESKYMLKIIDTGILEVFEWSDSVADRRFRLGRVMGVEIYA